MPLIINLAVYYTLYAYLFTAFVNFFHPITKVVSTAIIFGSIILSVITSRSAPLDLFTPLKRTLKISKVWLGLGLFCFLGWFFTVILRPAADVDSNIYHLPLSILMNHSVWYPGIGKLSSHFGFPNGNSVLSSVFTSFGVVGFENIPNMIIWLVFGMGIFMYLAKSNIRGRIALSISFLFLFTPPLFWRSYNMGVDVACACFLAFGFMALANKKLEDSILFFSLSALFRSFGTIALVLTTAYIIVRKLFKKEKIRLSSPKIILAYILFIVFSIRIFIATGNPVYPSFSLYFTPWAISPQAQTDLIVLSFQGYLGLERTVAGFLVFVKDFFLNPKVVKSYCWFSFFFFACLFSSLYVFFKERAYRKIKPLSLFICLLISLIFAAWFYINPLFRFVSGIFIFMTLQFFIFSHKRCLPKLFKAAVYLSLFLTLSLFLYNAASHIKRDVAPFVFVPWEDKKKLLPFKEDIFTVVKTKGGFEYTQSSSTYCGRTAVLPCLSMHSLGKKDELIQEYRKYNRL